MEKTSIFRNAIYKTILNAFKIGVPLITGIYIVRVLSVDAYAVFNLASAELDVFMIIGSLGIYSYGVRQLSRIRENRAEASRLFSELFTITAVTSFAAFFLALICLVSGTTHKMVYFVLSLQILATGMMDVDWVNEAYEEFGFISAKTIAVKLLYMLSLFVFVRKPDDILPYSLMITSSQFLNSLLGMAHIRSKVRLTLHDLHLRRHIRVLVVLALTSNVNILYSTIDKIFLGHVRGETFVSYYTIPFSIMAMVIALFDSIYNVSMPRLVILNRTDRQGYLDLYYATSNSYMFFVFPACMGMLCLAREIIVLYGTEKYLAAVWPMRLLCVFKIFASYEGLLKNTVFYAKDEEKYILKNLTVFGVLNVLSNVLLTLTGTLSVESTLIASIINEILLVLDLMRYCRRHLDPELAVFTRNHLRYAAVSALFIPISLAVHARVSSLWGCIILCMALCMTLYFGAMTLWKDEVMLDVWRRTGQILRRIGGKGTAK